MTDRVFKQIIKEARELIIKLARQNGWLWFYKMHQQEVVEAAEELLKLYPKADRQIVIIACWLHDISKYYAKNSRDIPKVEQNHHIDSAKIAGEILQSGSLDPAEIKRIKNCILRHRNKPGFRPETLEEKIIAVADTLSHFKSVFYLTYFKFHPKHSLERMVKTDLAKLERDWRDLGLLSRSREMVEKEYQVLKKMFKSYS